MSDPRRPFERVLRIHNRLQLRKPHVATKTELLNLCQIKERTLKSDIGYMRDVLDAPVHYNRKEKGWQYTEEYDISQHIGFTEKQFNRLRLGLEIITRYEQSGLMHDGELTKLRSKLQLSEGNPYHKYIYFEQVPYYKGAELVGFFLQAIEEQRPVQFQYESFKVPGLRNRILHPYVLKEREDRWYLIGKLPEFNEALVTYALDRIWQNEYLKILDETFDRDTNFSVENFFSYTYGMTVLNAQVEEVVLSFSSLQARYFQSKPFYPYEVIDRSKEGLIVKMKVIPNWEFVHKLMSYGDGVEVLQPKKLRDNIKEEFMRALHLYA